MSPCCLLGAAAAMPPTRFSTTGGNTPAQRSSAAPHQRANWMDEGTRSAQQGQFCPNRAAGAKSCAVLTVPRTRRSSYAYSCTCSHCSCAADAGRVPTACETPARRRRSSLSTAGLHQALWPAQWAGRQRKGTARQTRAPSAQRAAAAAVSRIARLHPARQPKGTRRRAGQWPQQRPEPRRQAPRRHGCRGHVWAVS
jgi:hypothetical protein